MLELVDILASEAKAERRKGSNPFQGTKFESFHRLFLENFEICMRE